MPGTMLNRQPARTDVSRAGAQIESNPDINRDAYFQRSRRGRSPANYRLRPKEI